MPIPQKPRKPQSTPALVRTVTRAWANRQKLVREWIAAKERGEGVSSCCNLEAHKQVIRTLAQCKRELRAFARKGGHNVR